MFNKSSLLLDWMMSNQLVRFVLESGKLEFIVPENESEQNELDDYRQELESIRIDTNLVNLLLIYDNVYIDEHTLGAVGYTPEAREMGSIFRPASNINQLRETGNFDLYTGNEYFFGRRTSLEEDITNLPAGFESSFDEVIHDLRYFEYFIYERYKSRFLVGRAGDPLSKEEFSSIISLCENERTWQSRGDSLTRNILLLNSDTVNLLNKYSIEEIKRHIYLLSHDNMIVMGDIRASVMHKAAVALSFLPLNKSLPTMYQLPEKKAENLWIPLKIYIEEVEWFPFIRNIDHVLEIKSNAAYRDFITVLGEWSNKIELGDPTEEGKFRREIRKANDALRHALKCKKIGGMLTYLSIPLLIFDALVGMPAFGASSGLIGTALQLYSSTEEWRNKWVMVGTYHR